MKKFSRALTLMLAAALALGLCLGMARMTLAIDSFPAVQTLYDVPMVGRVVDAENAPEVYKQLIEDKNFPMGTVFDWRNL